MKKLGPDEDEELLQELLDDEWDLEQNPVPLPPMCDLCNSDATHGQSTTDGIICPNCMRRV